MTDDALDRQIAALFAPAERIPDEAFVARVEAAVLAEQRLAAARQRAWRRFTVECLASSAVVAAFYLLWRLSPELTLEDLSITPAWAAMLVLFLWFGTVLRPAATGR